MASTRDEALDALWPDLAPSTAVNSLHQTIYFLRRLLEPDYKEGIGAGYLQFDGEVLSFDPALVRSASRRCWELISSCEGGRRDRRRVTFYTYTGASSRSISRMKTGRARIGITLHAAVLGVDEREIAQLLPIGDADGAARRAQRILLVDPTADEIELLLLPRTNELVDTRRPLSNMPTTRPPFATNLALSPRLWRHLRRTAASQMDRLGA